MRWFASLVLFLYRMLRFWPWEPRRLRWQLACVDLAIDAFHADTADELIVALMPVYANLHARVHGPAPEGDAAASLTNRFVIFGRILIQAGDEERGNRLLSRAVTFFSRPTSCLLTRICAGGIFDLGRAYLQLNRTEEALPWLKKALTLRTALYGDDSLEVAQCRKNLGDCLNRLGRTNEAELVTTGTYRLHTRPSSALTIQKAGQEGLA